MSYRILFILNALVVLVLGAAFLFVPERMLGFFGTETYASTVLVARFFGSAMAALGLVIWFAKDAGEGAQKGMGWSLFISALLGLIVNVIGISSASGVIRENGWISIVAYLAFGVLYAYMLFLKPAAKA